MEPIAIIIVGASGDLTRRKLIPALGKLCARGQIHPDSCIIGTGRSEFTHEAFRAHVDVPDEVARMLYFHQGFSGLQVLVAELGPFARTVAFLAQPPSAYAASARALAREGFGEETSLVIEKPFGYDLVSAQTLNLELHESFDESRIFRIDHYLGKEAVQNILVFRFANALFYPVWNSRYIESIQISAFEEIGVENRGAYFDKSGIIRDMVQNHLLQLLCLTTMEVPISLAAEDIRNQKINILRAIRVDRICRYQYQGYHEEKGVDPDSTTETFVEARLFIDTFRWHGMPVHIRTGKAVGRKGTEIGIRFKSLPRLLFNESGTIAPNQIIFKIQPAEGIIVDLASKVPGGELTLTNTNMAFCYRDSFKTEIPEAYQRLLLDAIKGDKTLFVSGRETETSWEKLEGFLDIGTVKPYTRGEAPAPCLCDNWIDFSRYTSICE